MGDLRARTAGEFQERRNAILAACETLCQDHEYDEITLTDIAQRTALSRPSMYNYYQRKEEVFLDLLKMKCTEWSEALQNAFTGKDDLTAEAFCEIFSELLCERELTLKLISLNLSAIEKNSSMDALVSFRQEEEKIPTLLLRILRNIFHDAAEEELGNMVLQIMVYIYGIYPITHFSPRLHEMWEQSGTAAPEPDMKSICFQGLHMMVDGFACHLQAEGEDHDTHHSL